MVNMFSYTSLLWLLVCCWCCVALAEHRMSYTGDSEEDRPTKTTTTATTDDRARCKDRIKNEDETDIDCGGILCPRCANTKTCKNKCDCVSGVCENKKCGGGNGGGDCVPACKNNGKCLDGKCSCPTGYQGPTCEIESHGLCSAKDLVDNDPILTFTFGNGPEQFSKKTPQDMGFITTYKQSYGPHIYDGYFGLFNSMNNGHWHKVEKDHTGDQGGYMLAVNADYKPGEFYRGTVKNLCVGRRYEFSAYLANICKPGTADIKPNVLFQVRTTVGNELLTELTSGDIAEENSFTWKKYGLSFTAKSNSIVLLMISHAPGGMGNDLVIDDITLRGCGKGSGFCYEDE